MAVDCLESASMSRPWSDDGHQPSTAANWGLDNSNLLFHNRSAAAPPDNDYAPAPSQMGVFESNNMFSCWSPILDEKVDRSREAVWSNVYNWMQSSSENSSSEECNESTRSGSDSMLQLSPQATCANPWPALDDHLPTFTAQARLPSSSSAPSFHQPQPVRPNDENLMSRMLQLNLNDNQPNQQRAEPPLYHEQSSRKWSTEESQPQQQSPVHYPSNYSSYNLNKPHDISALIEQYALADMQPQRPGRHHPQQQQQPIHQSHSQVWSDLSDDVYSEKPRRADAAQRHVFSPLNPAVPKQHSANSCDEAELQWYHQNLELQQTVYDHIYGMLLSGQVPLSRAPQAPFRRPEPSPLVAKPHLSGFHAADKAAAAPLSPPLAARNGFEAARKGRGGAPSDLQAKVDVCTEQYRQLEKERKKTEAELAKHNLGKKISSANNLPIPRLPPAPSRVDRLVVDFFREHARVVTLVRRMEQLRGQDFADAVHQTLRDLLDAVRLLQQRRLSERNAILSHLRGDVGTYDEERESAQLVEALHTVTQAVVRARAANWCALVQTLGPESHLQRMQLERIEALNFKCEPPEIKSRPLNCA